MDNGEIEREKFKETEEETAEDKKTAEDKVAKEKVINKVATVATIAGSFIIANWLANKLVGNGKVDIGNYHPPKSAFLPW